MRIALITAQGQNLNAAQPPAPGLLARALASQGHRVTVYARNEQPNGPRTAILGRGLSVEYIQAGPARPLSDEEAARQMPVFAARLADRWRTRRPDIVHAFCWVSGLAALGAARELPVPVVQTFESGQMSAGRARLEPSICRSAAAVLVSSAAGAAQLARFAVPRAAIRVIPQGVDTEVFTPDGDRARRTSRARIVTVATDGRAAGLTTIVQALSQVPGAELVVVGGRDGRHLPRSGPFRGAAQLASALRVRSRVTFAGEIGADRLPALLRSADVLVSAPPSEPSGAAVVQAMACGTPVVVSAVGAHLDAVIDGVTGLLIPPAQPAVLARRLRQLLAAPALRQAYGIAAADRARSRYSWERIASETLAAYQNCRPEAGAARAGDLADDEADSGADEEVPAALLRQVAAFA